MFNPALPICKNPNYINHPYFCQLVNGFKTSRISNSPFFSPSQDYSIKPSINRQARSYYGSYGAPATPTYYP